MIMWYWKDGSPAIPENAKSGSKKWVDAILAVEKKMSDHKYRIIGRDRLWWGGLVSTVWLGLDQSFFLGDKKNHKPVIFETIVFSRKGGTYGMRRQSSESQAKLEHSQTVEYWSNPFNLLKEWWERSKWAKQQT